MPSHPQAAYLCQAWAPQAHARHRGLPVRPTLTPPGTGQLRRLEGHEGEVNAVSVFADGTRALSGSEDETLRLWDLESGEELRRLEGHEGEVWAVSVFADGTRALSGSEDKTLRLWDLESGEEITAFYGDSGFACCDVTASNDLIVAGDRAGRIHVLDLLL